MTVDGVGDNPVRVAVVDDSVTIRKWLTQLLQSDSRLRVVGEAASGSEARDLLRKTPVDVMTLDVDMPGMSGIEFLERLMTHRPMPVVMVSALTEKGSNEAVKALSLGAVDCIEKPKQKVGPAMMRDICERVRQAASTQVASLNAARSVKSPPNTPRGAEEEWHGGVILLGASTGGVTALESVLAELEDCPWPIVIAQHMPENFLRSFARRLTETLSRNVYVATDGHVLKSGQAVLALGKQCSTRLVQSASGTISCQLGEPSERAHYRPCVDDLFESAATAEMNGVAALLTGMGNDGAWGLLQLRDAGFYTVGQDEASCVVYGMPKSAAEIGAVMEELPERDIGRRFADLTKNKRRYGHRGA